MNRFAQRKGASLLNESDITRCRAERDSSLRVDEDTANSNNFYREIRKKSTDDRTYKVLGSTCSKNEGGGKNLCG